MPLYNVRWEIEIDAATPEEAAMTAWSWQKEFNSTATFFEVYNLDEENTEIKTVDISPTYYIGGSPRQQEVFDDLLYKVHELLHNEIKEIGKRLKKLHEEGSGVLEAHNQKSMEGHDYTVPRQIVIALMREITDNNKVPPSVNTKKYRDEIDNYYTLL